MNETTSLSEEHLSEKPMDNDDLIVNLSGYEGPLDVLLVLAKSQKVDLMKISILQLTEQYLVFIANVRERNLELAADYLVMASWLTYLKSRLLLPQTKDDEESTPEELEAALKFQLQRLEAMQNISKILYSRPLIGRDVFYSRFTNNIKIKYKIVYTSTLYDLLKSYSSIIVKNDTSVLSIHSTNLFSVEEAIKRLQSIFDSIPEWTNFINLIPKLTGNNIINKSAISSNFAASLELAKRNHIELKQKDIFGTIFIRAKQK